MPSICRRSNCIHCFHSMYSSRILSSIPKSHVNRDKRIRCNCILHPTTRTTQGVAHLLVLRITTRFMQSPPSQEGIQPATHIECPCFLFKTILNVISFPLIINFRFYLSIDRSYLLVKNNSYSSWALMCQN